MTGVLGVKLGTCNDWCAGGEVRHMQFESKIITGTRNLYYDMMLSCFYEYSASSNA